MGNWKASWQAHASPGMTVFSMPGSDTYLTSTGASSGYFQGALDEVRIWSVARTQAEIISTINSELTSGTNLVARWGANEGIGTAIASSVGTFPGTLTNGRLGHPARHSTRTTSPILAHSQHSGNGTVTPPSGTYYEGLLQLTAVPNSGYAFLGWSGDLSGSTNPANITMNANKTVTATFGVAPSNVTVRVNQGSDDAEQNVSTGAMDLASTDLELIYDTANQLVGMRFQNVQVPPGATIQSAYIEFETDETTDGIHRL